VALIGINAVQCRDPEAARARPVRRSRPVTRGPLTTTCASEPLGVRRWLRLGYADERPGSIKVIIRFTDPEIIGCFVYHCHAVDHEDKGMMGTVMVVA
jgi:FtsP/CotA-like multicopper oxidase with cupredoxin domain